MNDITPKEAIANLNHLYGIVSPDMQRSLDVAIKALEEHPTGDCINREALKTDLRQYFTDGVLDGVSAKLAFNQILHDIDNAPTVNIKDELAGAYNEGYMCGSREAEKARPNEQKTKWVKIFENPFTNGYVCPFCGHKIQVTEQFLPQVTECESCGADMRKGGGNDNE